MSDATAWLMAITERQKREQGEAAALIEAVCDGADDLPVGTEMDDFEREAAIAWRQQIERMEADARQQGEEV